MPLSLPLAASGRVTCVSLSFSSASCRLADRRGLALLAHQPQVPTFTGVTLSSTSGLDSGMSAV